MDELMKFTALMIYLLSHLSDALFSQLFSWKKSVQKILQK
jgi:hypothetical protein